MRNTMFWMMSVLMVCYASVSVAKAPLGIWTTMDDKTGKKRSEIRLMMENNELSGQIIRVYTEAGDTGMCKACPGDFKDQPIQGLTFLWGLKEDKHGSWYDGEILDPKSGKIYRAKMIQKGDKLYVRGYVGLSLLGRTQIWVR